MMSFGCQPCARATSSQVASRLQMFALSNETLGRIGMTSIPADHHISYVYLGLGGRKTRSAGVGQANAGFRGGLNREAHGVDRRQAAFWRDPAIAAILRNPHAAAARAEGECRAVGRHIEA